MKDYEKVLAIGVGIASIVALGLFVKSVSAKPSSSPTLFFAIKNDPVNGPVTTGKVAQIYSYIAKVAFHAGFNFGLDPQCVDTWENQLIYFREFANIPVMLNVWTSDNNYQISVAQIQQAMAVCPVVYLRFHEVMSYYASSINTPAVQSYIQSILAFSKSSGIPLFWNEWDITTYPAIANIIQGYEDNVLISFGTNNISIQAGFQALQTFQKKAASVQAFYWTTLNGQSYLLMPPALMAQFTVEAFQAGCEIIEYEPYLYFFYENATPNITLTDMFNDLG